jgi:hypothetical protein
VAGTGFFVRTDQEVPPSQNRGLSEQRSFHQQVIVSGSDLRHTLGARQVPRVRALDDLVFLGGCLEDSEHAQQRVDERATEHVTLPQAGQLVVGLRSSSANERRSG